MKILARKGIKVNGYSTGRKLFVYVRQGSDIINWGNLIEFHQISSKLCHFKNFGQMSGICIVELQGHIAE